MYAALCLEGEGLGLTLGKRHERLLDTDKINAGCILCEFVVLEIVIGVLLFCATVALRFFSCSCWRISVLLLVVLLF